jgi:hypothetical protein
LSASITHSQNKQEEQEVIKKIFRVKQKGGKERKGKKKSILREYNHNKRKRNIL